MPLDFRASRDVIIRTNNLDEAVHFYERVLGLAITPGRASRSTGSTLARFSCMLNVERRTDRCLIFTCRILKPRSGHCSMRVAESLKRIDQCQDAISATRMA